jgi:hypothetical protein
MKGCNRHNPAIAAVGAWWLSHIAGPVRALHYGCAAEQDERNGFPYTAAMEWRKAAELFAANAQAAEYSWRQWERIMQLPRRLAGAVGDSEAADFPLTSASSAHPAISPITLTAFPYPVSPSASTGTYTALAM